MGALILGAAVTVTLRAEEEPRWTSVHIRKLGISTDYPDDWHVQRFDHELGLLAYRRGMILSNVPHIFTYPDLGPNRATSAWNMKALPQNSVVTEISQTVRFPDKCRQTSRLPLSLAVAERYEGNYGSPPHLVLTACIEGKQRINVHAWIWPDASSEDRASVRRIVSSIRPSS